MDYVDSNTADVFKSSCFALFLLFIFPPNDISSYFTDNAKLNVLYKRENIEATSSFNHQKTSKIKRASWPGLINIADYALKTLSI
jgi:hypothetical protein